MVKEVKAITGYIPTYQSVTRVSVGDIVRIHDGVVEFANSLNGLGGRFEAEEDPARGSQTWSSRGGVSALLKAEGDVAIPGSTLADADVGATIKFSRKNAAYLYLEGMRTAHFVGGSDRAHEFATALYKQGRFPQGGILVTQVVVADSGVLAYSSERDALADFKIDAGGGEGLPSLADLAASSHVAWQRGMAESFQSASRFTPLFSGWGFRWRLVGGTQLRTLGGDTEEGIAPRPPEEERLELVWDETGDDAYEPEVWQ